MKKTVTLILAIALAVSACVVHAMYDSFEYDPETNIYSRRFEYFENVTCSGGFLLQNNTIGTYSLVDIVEDLSDEEGTLVIPAEIDGKIITSIDLLALPASVKHVRIPETVRRIRFCSGESLESVNLDPNCEISFSNGGGIRGENLKTFTADGKNWVSPLWEICSVAFSGSGVETIILDRSLSTWYERSNLGWHFKEQDVFKDCKNLRTVYMTDNVRSIYDQTSLDPSRKGGGNFANCTGLDYLCFPESINVLGTTFTNCTSLRTAVFPAKDVNLTYLLLEDTTANNRERSTFRNCHKLTIFGKYGTTVEDYAKEANIPFIGSIINHGEPSTVVAKAAQTATVWLNGYEIPAYTVNGSVYVGESALKSFGFGMDWDGEARTTTVTKPENVDWAVELNTNPEPYSLDVYSSDVKFMMNGFPIPYLCVGYGESIVDVNALAEAVLY